MTIPRILGHPVVVLSYRYWQTRFAADPSILNKTMVLNGHNFTVIGVAERGFDGIEPGSVTELFVPVTMKAWMTPNVAWTTCRTAAVPGCRSSDG